ncbi:MAG: hypothetical protein LUQ09_08480 [Methanomassiliicoccales archaeon]|nr:hypothetical protein [Methanomassiliicoccales archaeon]
MNFKGYNDPFNDTEDICGLRIICFFISDLAKVSDIIKSEFNVISIENKTDMMEPDRFGYRSDHYIVTLRDSWLQGLKYRGLGDIKAEIQVRTILMHGWADIEHKFGYKQFEDVPPKLRRSSCRLSALLEIADELFDNMREEREEYIGSLPSIPIAESHIISEGSNNHFDMDVLQFILDHYIPSIPGDEVLNSVLINKFNEEGLRAKDLMDAFEAINKQIPNINDILLATHEQIPINQGLYALIVMAISNDMFWEQIRKDLPEEFSNSVDQLKTKAMKKMTKRRTKR